jgi:hypothetical protein
MKIYRTLAMIGILIIAILLAFPLRGAVYEVIIIPLAFVLWALGLAYHSVPQALWWIGVLLIVLVILSRSLASPSRTRARMPLKTKPIVGKVESLSVWMKKSERGTYFKWLVANRLGKIAYAILSQRETGKQRSFFDPLTGSDWNPNVDVHSYLEAGLHGSFTNYPRSNKLFSRSAPTPLDLDVKEAVEFLESQIGNQ